MGMFSSVLCFLHGDPLPPSWSLDKVGPVLYSAADYTVCSIYIYSLVKQRYEPLLIASLKKSSRRRYFVKLLNIPLHS